MKEYNEYLEEISGKIETMGPSVLVVSPENLAKDISVVTKPSFNNYCLTTGAIKHVGYDATAYFLRRESFSEKDRLRLWGQDFSGILVSKSLNISEEYERFLVSRLRKVPCLLEYI